MANLHKGATSFVYRPPTNSQQNINVFRADLKELIESIALCLPKADCRLWILQWRGTLFRQTLFWQTLFWQMLFQLEFTLTDTSSLRITFTFTRGRQCHVQWSTIFALIIKITVFAYSYD